MSLSMDKAAWKRVSFGDVVKNVNLTVKDPEAEGIDRVVAMEHLDSGALRVARWGDVADGTTFTRRVRPGQTLFGKRRAYQRKAAFAEFEAICSGDILVFEADEAQMLPEFLPFLVQSDGFFDHALGTSAGSLSPRTNWTDLAGYEFCLPSLDEQRRLADLMWASVDSLVASKGVLGSMEAVARAWRASVFTFGDRDRLDALVEVSLGRQRAPQHATGDHLLPYVRAANVKSGRIDLADVKVMNFTPVEQEKFRLEAGDVLVTEGCGSLAELGNSAVWQPRGDGQEMFFQKTLIRLRAIAGRSHPAVVREWARWAQESGEFARIAQGTGIFHLTAVRCAALPFPRFGAVDGDRIARQADALERALASHRDAIAAEESMRSSLMKAMWSSE